MQPEIQPEPQSKGGSNIPLWEWGLVFCIALSIDIGEWFMDNVLFIGFIINPIDNILIGPSLAFYWWLRGVKPTIGKGLVQMALTGAEMLGDGELPLWCLDVAVMFFMDKADRIIKGPSPPPNGGQTNVIDASDRFQNRSREESEMRKAA